MSCRNYRSVIETIAGSVGVNRSSVGRAFVRATEQGVREFYRRRYIGTRFLTIFIDGVHFKGQMLIVAIGVTSEGRKVVLSVRQGATRMRRCVRTCSKSSASEVCRRIRPRCSSWTAPRRCTQP